MMDHSYTDRLLACNPGDNRDLLGVLALELIAIGKDRDPSSDTKMEQVQKFVASYEYLKRRRFWRTKK
jgi:hypothetical protein